MGTRTRPESVLPAEILVGVDETGSSDHAARMGCELGRRFSVRVDLVHAFHPAPDFWPGIDPLHGAEMNAKLREERRKRIEERTHSILETLRSPSRAGGAVAAPTETGRVRFLTGHPARDLLEEARARNAGLIVLGGHQKRSPFDLGSTVRAVFARSKVPLWVQPRPAVPLRRIVAAVDLSEKSLSALAAARSLAQAFEGTVHAVHCFHASTVLISAGLGDPDQVLSRPSGMARGTAKLHFEEAMEVFDWQGVEHETEFVEGEPVQALLELSAKSELLVVGAHGRTGLSSTVLGGVAYAILKLSAKPTLVVPHADQAFLS
ncbi:MAG: universal stress protein [Planctomycetota bacterium]